jgi:hypothetical protein
LYPERPRRDLRGLQCELVSRISRIEENCQPRCVGIVSR